MADRQAEVGSRLKKKENETALSVPQEETKTCNASGEFKVVTQPNTYSTPDNEVTTDKLETTAENSKVAVKELDDNDSFTDATVAPATTNAAENKIVVNDKESFDNEHDASIDKTQEEEPAPSTAAVEEESLAKTENDEVGKEYVIPKNEAGELEKQVPEFLH
ncbi:hypothetical protein FQA39_LY08098 [Lamprigera yunnana]|nr:hypothetical protein FQA39_LY08098 [Lamprigera yunnana]